MKPHKLLCLAVCLFVFNTHHAQTFREGVVVEDLVSGTGGVTGEYTSLLVVNGNPSIVCYNRTRSALVYMRATDASGVGWSTPLMLDSVDDVGQYASMAIVNGNPAVAYYDATNNDLKYVRAADASGSSWGAPVTVVSTGGVGEYCSLQVVNGNPAISYYDASGDDLMYVRATDASGSSWGSPVNVDASGVTGLHTSLNIVNGNPAIAYHNESSDDLLYVRATDASGSSWSSPVNVDATDDVGQDACLVVVNGNPAISYLDNTSNDLKYARAADASGSSWNTPIAVDTAGKVGNYTSMAIVNGSPAISYWDITSFDLKYVRAGNASGTSWNTPVRIDSTCFVGRYSSMQVVNGNPAISYLDGTNNDLKYVRASNASGSGWNTPLSFDASPSTGYYASVAIVNGNPAISYQDITNENLRYVRANDGTGKTWGTPLVLDSSAEAGKYSSMVVVDGNPAIAYLDEQNWDLKYIRATNAEGTSWGSPVTVVSTNSVGRYCTMTVVNGNPAIAYQDVTNGYLMYVRATDVSGTSWASPVTIDASGNAGRDASLYVVDGNPAISYLEDSGGDSLKYVRATDSFGTSWNSPVTIDEASNHTSLSIINGNPAISYHEGGDLKYVRANNVAGSSWGAPVTPDATGDVGARSSLTVVDGHPAISYHDETNSTLKYIRATDASGSSWGTAEVLDSLGSTETGERTSMYSSGGEVFIAYRFTDKAVAKFIYGSSYSWTGGAGNSNWFTTANWSNTAVPTASSTAIIPEGLSFYPDIDTGVATCLSLRVDSAADFTISGGTIQVAGDIENEDTIDATGGAIVLNGTEAQLISANIISATSLTLDNNSGATINDGTINILESYSPTSGTLATGGNLVLVSSASNTGVILAGNSGGGYLSGDVVTQRYNTGKRAYRFYGHPFTSSIALNELTDDIDITGSGGASNGFTTTATNNPSAFWFDVTNGDTSTTGNNPGWTAFTSAGATDWDQYELLLLFIRGAKGEGLTGGSYTPSPVTFEAAGTVNQGTQVATLTKGSNTDFAGCGNPFPCGVQMQNISTGSNVGANYYVWDATSGAAGAYVTNAYTLPYILPPWGAFFTTVSVTDNITFEEADKVSGGAALFKTTVPKNWVELYIYDSTNKWDRLLIHLDDNSMAAEDKMDGKKLYNPGLDFYTLSKDTVRLAVDVRPYDDGKRIPLGLAAYNRYNKYVIKVGMFDIPAGTKLVLHDKYLNTQQELKPGFEYWFDVTSDSATQGDNRFELNMVGKPTTGIIEAKNEARVYISPNPAYDEVKISFAGLEGEAQLKLVSVTGQVLYTQRVHQNTGRVIIPLQDIPAGMYLIELRSRNKMYSEKLIRN